MLPINQRTKKIIKFQISQFKPLASDEVNLRTAGNLHKRPGKKGSYHFVSLKSKAKIQLRQTGTEAEE